MKAFVLAATLLLSGSVFAHTQTDSVTNKSEYTSYEDCTTTVSSRADLISRDVLLDTCAPYLKTSYDRCQAFLISDGKWDSMFACSAKAKEGEVVVRATGEVVDICSYMNWNCGN